MRSVMLLFIVIIFTLPSFCQKDKTCKQSVIRYTNTYGNNDTTWALKEYLNDSTFSITEYYGRKDEGKYHITTVDTFITSGRGWKKIFKGEVQDFLGINSFKAGTKTIEHTAYLDETNTVFRYTPDRIITINGEQFMKYNVDELSAGNIILDSYKIVFHSKLGIVKKFFLGKANWIRSDYLYLDKQLGY